MKQLTVQTFYSQTFFWVTAYLYLVKIGCFVTSITRTSCFLV